MLPEVDALSGVPQRAEYHPEIDTGTHLCLVLDAAARAQAPLEVRFACLTHDLGKGTTPPDQWPRHIGHEQRSVTLLRQLAERLRVPLACKELAEVVAREHGHIHQSGTLGAAAVLRLLVRCDALRRPERFEQVLLACACDAWGRAGLADQSYAPRARLWGLLQAALQVNTAELAAQAQAQGLSGAAIGTQVEAAREAALQQSGWL